MIDEPTAEFQRMDVLKRLLKTIVCLVAFEVVKGIMYVAVLFQYLYLLIARNHSEVLRRFCSRMSTYGYKLMRYAMLVENRAPFPFTEFPLVRDGEKPDAAPEFTTR